MIHVENLTKFYGDFCAVDHINLDINKGEIVGLLGPNGAGKSTTLKMLTGYFPPSEGDVKVNDLSIARDPRKVKSLIGYLPETASFYNEMLVYDYLCYVAAIRGIEPQKRDDRIAYLADLCDLNGVMHKTIGELSKGLNQRVGLVHAMMSDPDILILDEPTQGLDPNQIVGIRSLIKKVGEEKTIIFSTHILSEAEATCNRIVIINRGRIVADGTAEEIKHGIGKAALLHITLGHADFDSVSKELKGIDGVKSVHLESQEGNNVSVLLTGSPGVDLREAVYLKIKSSDWIILNFYQEEQTLESIFRSLTTGDNEEN